ncbi:MAG: hypothetical protein ACRCXZ_07530 [Patescibacteria group bacterium]
MMDLLIKTVGWIGKYRKYLFLILNKFVALVIGLFINFWLNKSIPSQNLAQLTLALTFSVILINSTSFGLSTSAYHFFLKNKNKFDRSVFLYTVFIVQILTYFLNLAIFVFSNYFFLKLDWIVLLIIFTSQVILSNDNTFKAIGDASNNSHFFTLSDLVNKMFIGVIIFLFFVFSITGVQALYYYLIIVFLGSLIQFCLDFYNFRHQFEFRNIKFDLNIFNDNINRLKLLTASAVLVAGYQYTDKFYISNIMKSNEALNGYNNLYKIYELFFILPHLVLPILFRKYYFNNAEQKISKYKLFKDKYFGFSFIFSMLNAIAFLFISPVLLRLIDSESKYIEYSNQAIWPLFASLLPFSFIYFLDTTYVNLQLYRREIFILILTVVITNISYLILIQNFGVLGAALATSLSIYLLIILRLILLPKKIKLS